MIGRRSLTPAMKHAENDRLQPILLEDAMRVFACMCRVLPILIRELGEKKGIFTSVLAYREKNNVTSLLR